MQVGPAEAYKRAASKLDSYTPLGYSLCGIVDEVGRDAEEFSVGQLVACAGNEHALHAEVNWVPANLCVPVPVGVPAEHAAFATVGAIAMHGVRRAEVQLGESACVIGLGLVGQLVGAAARRCRRPGRRIRCRCWTLRSGRSSRRARVRNARPRRDRAVEAVVAAATGGLGADHVLIAAGGASNDPVHIAARIARDRARVVDVGKCSLDLPWNAYYDKELDVRFSRSYGPGRYDDRYELDGIDYPAGYVRWTERRNLACFVDLLEREALPIELLVSGTFPVEQATEVYAGLADRHARRARLPVRIPGSIGPDAACRSPRSPASPPERRGRVASRAGALRVGFIGAGNYASSMLLPHLKADHASSSRTSRRRVHCRR